MSKRRVGKPLTNESRYPYIVELAVTGGALGFALSRQIINFHKARQIQPLHGRWTYLKREGKAYHCWCFSDLKTAQSFIEQFGGTIKQK
jgi:hypothetical protein